MRGFTQDALRTGVVRLVALGAVPIEMVVQVTDVALGQKMLIAATITDVALVE